ncbi:MAG: hypothetical protein QXO94_05250 [Candidatus Bathyarchaeia archaeon]
MVEARFVRFLEELRRTRAPGQEEDPEKAIRQWRIALLNKLAESDPQLIQLKGLEISLDLQRIWNPRLLFLLRKNIFHFYFRSKILFFLYF